MKQLLLVLCLAFSSTSLFADPTPTRNPNPVKESKLAISTVHNSLALYLLDCGKYPEKLEGLFSNLDNCTNWGPDPYLSKRKYILDGWQNQLFYELVGARYSIKSLGSDGKLGGEGEAADIILEQ